MYTDASRLTCIIRGHNYKFCQYTCSFHMVICKQNKLPVKINIKSMSEMTTNNIRDNKKRKKKRLCVKLRIVIMISKLLFFGKTIFIPHFNEIISTFRIFIIFDFSIGFFFNSDSDRVVFFCLFFNFIPLTEHFRIFLGDTLIDYQTLKEILAQTCIKK